ncbi:hypothetical protein Acr_00g0031020 [Actinidia rufa]|uniref:Retrovirus-related Pol polyprotein from transposon TNT 1-94-like beta-barrel domain-containing protein n=1 Tax=Actinidia rufa TaxID=165716 RepID=A0A7J0DG83_9ERIC|nr:hypothetical protein Acr_00g0031020 [Actinidia rufa]
MHWTRGVPSCSTGDLQRETTVAEHTSEFQSLINQLTSVDLQFDDEMQALLLLSSLLESWETLVVSLSNSVPNEKLTTSMVMDALFNKEARRREMGLTDQSESCFYYDQEEHIKRDCPKYKAQDQSSDTAATVVMAVDENEIDVLLAASDNGKSDWVLDSGSAYHLCRDREVFSTYAACEEHIWMANNTSSRVVGRGSVRFRMANGRDAALRLMEEFSEFSREARRCCGERRLEGYTNWRGMSRQEELLSDMGPMVLAKRMDKGSNRCIEVHKASAGVLRGSIMVPGESGVVQERREMLCVRVIIGCNHKLCHETNNSDDRDRILRELWQRIRQLRILGERLESCG